VCKALQASA